MFCQSTWTCIRTWCEIPTLQKLIKDYRKKEKSNTSQDLYWTRGWPWCQGSGRRRPPGFVSGKVIRDRHTPTEPEWWGCRSRTSCQNGSGTWLLRWQSEKRALWVRVRQPQKNTVEYLSYCSNKYSKSEDTKREFEMVTQCNEVLRASAGLYHLSGGRILICFNEKKRTTPVAAEFRLHVSGRSLCYSS